LSFPDKYEYAYILVFMRQKFVNIVAFHGWLLHHVILYSTTEHLRKWGIVYSIKKQGIATLTLLNQHSCGLQWKDENKKLGINLAAVSITQRIRYGKPREIHFVKTMWIKQQHLLVQSAVLMWSKIQFCRIFLSSSSGNDVMNDPNWAICRSVHLTELSFHCPRIGQWKSSGQSGSHPFYIVLHDLFCSGPHWILLNMNVEQNFLKQDILTSSCNSWQKHYLKVGFFSISPWLITWEDFTALGHCDFNFWISVIQGFMLNRTSQLPLNHASVFVHNLYLLSKHLATASEFPVWLWWRMLLKAPFNKRKLDTLKILWRLWFPYYFKFIIAMCKDIQHVIYIPPSNNLLHVSQTWSYIASIIYWKTYLSPLLNYS